MKYLTIGITTCVILILALTFSLPTLLSTKWGQNKVEEYLNSGRSGKISFTNLNLHFWGKQHIEGIELRDSKGNKILDIANLVVDESVPGIVLNGINRSHVEVENLNAQVVAYDDGTNNILKALSPAGSDSAKQIGDPIIVNNVDANINLEDPLLIKAHGETLQGDLKGQFNSDITISGINRDQLRSLVDHPDQLFNGKTNLNVKVEAQNFPVELIDSFLSANRPDLSGVVVGLVGPKLNLSVDQTMINNGQGIAVNLKLDSRHLKGDFIGKISPQQDKNQLSVDIKGEAIHQGEPIRIGVQTAISKNFDLEKNGIPPSNISLERIPLALIDNFLGLNNKLLDLIGPYANLNLKTANSKSDTYLTLNFESEKLNIPGVQLKINDSLTFAEPLVLNYIIGDHLNKHFLNGNQSVKLPSGIPLAVTITMDPIKNFKRMTDLTQIDLAGRISIDSIRLNVQNSNQFVTIQNLALPWKINAAKNQIKVNLMGSTHLSNNPVGQLNAELILKDWIQAGQMNLSTASMDAKAKLSQIPSSILESFTQKPELSVLLGDKIDLDLNTTLSLGERSKGVFNVTISGNQLNGSASLSLNENLILERPGLLEITLTPERFAALRKLLNSENSSKDALSLIEPAKVNLAINSILIPLSNSPALSRVCFDTSCSIDHLAVRDNENNQTLSIENLQSKIQANDLQNNINFNVSAKQRNPGQNPTDLAANGQITKAINNDGSLNLKDLSLKLDSKISALPINLFCRVICIDPATYSKIEALFGSSLNADIHVALQAMNGPIQANITGQNGNVKLDSTISNGIMYLNNPFTAEFAVTPKLGRSLLQEIFPLLGGIVMADQPVKITVDNNGFAMPIKDFNVAQINIKNAMLSMGKVKFTKEGQLGDILSLLTPADSELIVVWFTPLYVNMHQGVLTLERIDLLISNQFPVATWGNVNFVKDKVDMVIGLSGYAISHAFNLPGLEASDMLQIPLKGTTSNAGIDKRKAAAKISALVAQSRGNAQGMLLGTVLHIAGGGLSEGPVPSPTTNPLPWAGQMKQAQPASEKPQQPTSDADQPKKKSKRNKVDAVQEIQNQAGNLLDQLLR